MQLDGIRNRDVNRVVREMAQEGWVEDRDQRTRRGGDRFTLIFGCQV